MDGKVQVAVCLDIEGATEMHVRAIGGPDVTKENEILWRAEGHASISRGDVFDAEDPPAGMKTTAVSDVPLEPGMKLVIQVVSPKRGVLGSFPVTESAVRGEGWTFWSGKHDEDSCNVRGGVSG